jgi:hypothetical protein
MYVGPQGEPGEERFQLTVCTPSALAEQLRQRPFLIGRHWLFVAEFHPNTGQGGRIETPPPGPHGSFAVRFDRCRRFPGVLYLAPTPDQAFRALTEAVVARRPEVPPYGGRFAEIVPHLTVAYGLQAHALDEVEAALTAQLLITAHVASVGLFVSDGDRWHRRDEFALLGE